MRRRRVLRTAVLSAVLALATPAFAGDAPHAPRPRAATKKAVTADQIAERLDLVLETGLNTINPDEVAALLLDANATNDPFLLDVRDSADFARGHVPGAVNVPLRKLPSAWLRDPDLIPADRNVVVVSYYGGDGNMASFLVNSVRIEDPAAWTTYPWSKAMFMGMMSWTHDPALCNGHRFDTDLGVMRVDRATATAARTPEAKPLPKIRPIRARSVSEAILRRADTALRAARRPNDLQVPAPKLAALLDATSDPTTTQVLSVRATADYAKGHVPGAFNIPWKDVALADKRAQIDPKAPVYVYCYTGHTGSIATMALRILGYDARNMLYGLDGWRPAAEIGQARLAKFDLNKAWDFPVDDGGDDDLGTMTAWHAPTGCVGCHTDLTGIWYDRTVANPPPGAVTAPSLGEG